jgi:hypothetical protein
VSSSVGSESANHEKSPLITRSAEAGTRLPCVVSTSILTTSVSSFIASAAIMPGFVLLKASLEFTASGKRSLVTSITQ